MNLRRLLTGIALRQIEVPALTQTSVHLTMYECTQVPIRPQTS